MKNPKPLLPLSRLTQIHGALSHGVPRAKPSRDTRVVLAEAAADIATALTSVADGLYAVVAAEEYEAQEEAASQGDEAGSVSDGERVLAIRECARCHETTYHERLTFRALAHSVEVDGRVVATHWAMCPVLAQPILMVIHDEEQR